MSGEKKNKGRRNFLKTGMAGIAGAAVLPAMMKAEKKAPPKDESSKKPKGNFIYRTLGNTGLKVPIVSMGVMNATNPQLVRAALEAGILHLDTAHYYSRGQNEKMVGEVIKDIPRDSFILSTKARPNTVDRESAQDGAAVKDETVESFMAKVDISLKRLQTDYVDILYLHSAKSKADVFNEVAMTAMQKLKKAGKIRHIGVSTHANEPEVLRAAVESKVYEVVLTSYLFRQKNLAEVEKAIEYAAKAGMGIVAMKTQAGVFWDRERTKPINMKAALKWALQNKNIHTSIPGFTTFDQMETDLSIMGDMKMTAQELQDLKPEEKTIAGLYCQQCEQCLGQCSKNPDIPTLMRSYMYAYGYRNPALARETLESVDLTALPCKDCTACGVTCPMSFNIREKVLDIARIKDVPNEFLV
ncbi:MAG: oxidoreductase [bacterium]|nr:oxidoreductase [bacterium]